MCSYRIAATSIAWSELCSYRALKSSILLNKARKKQTNKPTYLKHNGSSCPQRYSPVSDPAFKESSELDCLPNPLLCAKPALAFVLIVPLPSCLLWMCFKIIWYPILSYASGFLNLTVRQSHQKGWLKIDCGVDL